MRILKVKYNKTALPQNCGLRNLHSLSHRFSRFVIQIAGDSLQLQFFLVLLIGVRQGLLCVYLTSCSSLTVGPLAGALCLRMCLARAFWKILSLGQAVLVKRLLTHSTLGSTANIVARYIFGALLHFSIGLGTATTLAKSYNFNDLHLCTIYTRQFICEA